MNENFFAAWFIGETLSTTKATSIIERYKKCPHIYFISQKEHQVYGIFLLDLKQKWWIEFVEHNPGKETLGFESISITYLTDISYPDSFELQRQRKSLEIAPCGSKCCNCPQNFRCVCCPATIWHISNAKR